ncbi:MAG: hypothetical protein J0M02_05530 [Planctomycetes bacterium]|nr:hypothetical protein [Planctomycetota bacterium]
MSSIQPLVLPEHLCRSPRAEDRIQAVIEYVNRMFEAHVQPDELRRDVLAAYYVDFYLDHASGPGLERFMTRSRWDPLVVACIHEGLAACGAGEHARLFRSFAAAVDAWDAGVRRQLARGILLNPGCIAAVQAHRAAMLAIEASAGERLLDLNARRIAQLAPAEILGPAAYERRMAALTAPNAERLLRGPAMEQMLWTSRTPVERAVRAWADSNRRPVQCQLADTQVVWRSAGASAVVVQAGGRRYRAIAEGQDRVVIVDDDNRQQAVLALGPFTAPHPPRTRQASRPATATVIPRSEGGTNWGLIFAVIGGFIILRIIIKALRQ